MHAAIKGGTPNLYYKKQRTGIRFPLNGGGGAVRYARRSTVAGINMASL